MRSRQLFENWVQYILSCVGFAVGLGNVWRFPKVCLDNGGGAFLIPYFTVLFLLGVPLMVIELTLGQRYRGSPVHTFGRAHRHLFGIGISMGLVSFSTGLYYTALLAYGIIYFFNSFQPDLPWTKCPPEASNACGNITSPTEYFFYNKVAQQSDGLDDSKGGHGGFVWHLYVAILIGWFIVFVSLSNGVKSLGKVVYFTCLYPYVMLTAMIVIGVQLDGAWDGLKFLFKPDLMKLLEPRVWLAATQQVFFSASLGLGGMLTMASHMPVCNSAFRDSLVIMGVNALTSLYASVGIFSVKGHMANKALETCVAEGNVSCSFDQAMRENESGIGLIYMAMASAVDSIGGGFANLLSIGFYLMIICLGVGSVFGCVKAFVTIFLDIGLLRKVPRYMILLVACAVSAGAAILFATTRGPYFIEIFDYYGSMSVLVIVGLFEFVGVGWVHGMHEFCRDFHIVNDFHPFFWIKFIIKYLSPLILLAAIVGEYVYVWRDETLFKYKDSGETYPGWAIGLCCGLFFITIIPIPICAFVACFLRCCDIGYSFGGIDYNENEIIKDLEPVEYYGCERLICCIGEEFDFPENVNLTFVMPQMPSKRTEPVPSAPSSPGQYRSKYASSGF